LSRGTRSTALLMSMPPWSAASSTSVLQAVQQPKRNRVRDLAAIAAFKAKPG
jgi:hypothetical protein